MSKRDSKSVRASRALRVLQDPEFQAAFDTQREGVISSLERLSLDGSPEVGNQALELVRRLQAGNEFKRELIRTLRAGDAEAQREARKARDEELYDPTAVKPND